MATISRPLFGASTFEAHEHGRRCGVPKVDTLSKALQQRFIGQCLSLRVARGWPMWQLSLFLFHTCEISRIKFIVSGPVASSKLFFEWCAVVCWPLVLTKFDAPFSVAHHSHNYVYQTVCGRAANGGFSLLLYIASTLTLIEMADLALPGTFSVSLP